MEGMYRCLDGRREDVLCIWCGARERGIRTRTRLTSILSLELLAFGDSWLHGGRREENEDERARYPPPNYDHACECVRMEALSFVRCSRKLLLVCILCKFIDQAALCYAERASAHATSVTTEDPFLDAAQTILLLLSIFLRSSLNTFHADR